MPDGRHLRSQVIGLAYYDEATSNSVMFAETKDSIGQLLQSSNQVIYTNAFTDFQADVRYTHTKGKFEQDVILRSQPPPPAQYGLNSQSTLIESACRTFLPSYVEEEKEPADDNCGSPLRPANHQPFPNIKSFAFREYPKSRSELYL